MMLAIRSGVPHTVWLDDLTALHTAVILYQAMDAETEKIRREHGA